MALPDPVGVGNGLAVPDEGDLDAQGDSGDGRRRLGLVNSLLVLAQADDGVNLPSDGGSALVWVLFLGIIAVLWAVVSRTRRRAEEEYWERKRREEEGRGDQRDLE